MAKHPPRALGGFSASSIPIIFLLLLIVAVSSFWSFPLAAAQSDADNNILAVYLAEEKAKTNSVTVAPPQCNKAAKCGDCIKTTGCNWCTAFLTVTTDKSKVSQMPFGIPGVCTATTCDGMEFGTFKDLFKRIKSNNPEYKGLKIQLDIMAANNEVCDDIKEKDIKGSFTPAVFTLNDCDTCVKAIDKGTSKAWCQYHIKMDNNIASVNTSGGVCAPCAFDKLPAMLEEAKIDTKAVKKSKDVNKCKGIDNISFAYRLPKTSTMTVIGLAILVSTTALIGG